MVIPSPTEPYVIWVGPRDGDAGPLPLGSRAWSTEEAQFWEAQAEWPADLLLLRRRGAVVRCRPDASRETKSVVRRLRQRLGSHRPSMLAEVAEELGLHYLADRLRTWPPDVPLSFANLAAACGDDSLQETARVFLALEHL